HRHPPPVPTRRSSDLINGYAELLLGTVPPGDPLRDMLSDVRQAGERASSLTRQLLAFSRKQVLQPKVLDLNGVVSEMGKMLRRVDRKSTRLNSSHRTM